MNTLKNLLLTCAFCLFATAAAHATGPSGCTIHSSLTTTASGVQQVVPAVAGQNIYVCSVVISVTQPSSSPANFSLVSGTGTNCATGQVIQMPVFTGVASFYQTYSMPSNANIHVPISNAVCLNLSAAPTSATIEVYYAVQ